METRATATPSQMPRFKQVAAAILGTVPEIDAAYLFGSAVAGKLRAGSDFDPALVARALSGERKLDILAAFTREGFDAVDLVVLGDDAVLRFEAVRQNCLVYAKPDFDHGAYYSRGLREYFDLLPILKRQRDALKRRLADASA
jgi:predicted nucleotidyltransferase